MPQEPSGLLLFVACFLGALGLIGLLKLNHWWQTRHAPKSDATRQSPAATEHQRTSQSAAAVVTIETHALALRTWLDYLNAQPDHVPHLAIIGPSGAGKTTFATAVLHDREGQIIVITAKEGDRWAGLPYVGIDDDTSYRTAALTMDRLLAEVKTRLVASKHDQPVGDVLTIVVDDFSTLKNECPAAPELVKLVARLGRSLRVRLMMLSDSALVKAIGLEGEGETRSNFAFVRLARGHKGTLEIDAVEQPIDTSAVSHLARQANLAARAWQAPTIDHTGMEGGKAANHTSMPYQYGSNIPDIDAAKTGMVNHTGMNERDRAILAILSVNPSASKNRIYDAVGGDRNAVMARIDDLRDKG
jgi:hypothetical protein